jgi:hypothetical protein
MSTLEDIALPTNIIAVHSSNVPLGRVHEAERFLRDRQLITHIFGRKYVVTSVKHRLSTPGSLLCPPLYSLMVTMQEVNVAGQS